MLNLINVGRAAPVIYQVQVPKSDNAFAVNFMRPLQDAHKGFSSSSAGTRVVFSKFRLRNLVGLSLVRKGAAVVSSARFELCHGGI